MSTSDGREPTAIEVVEDRTAASTCDDGFLRVRRLTLRNVYEDGTVSRTYACDVVSRRYVDAVAVVLHGRDAAGSVHVALRTGVRPPVWLREAKAIPHAPPAPRLLAEVVAGVIEDEDAGPGGLETRAAAESLEEAGYAVDAASVRPLGAPLFPTPGVADEMVHFRHAEVDLEARGEPEGDGSVMEEAGEVVVLPLREAIRRCRSGALPDMKTEVMLLRLADAVGYVPALDCFLNDLPEAVHRAACSLPPLLPASEDGAERAAGADG